jgi:hypothetical protein
MALVADLLREPALAKRRGEVAVALLSARNLGDLPAWLVDVIVERETRVVDAKGIEHDEKGEFAAKADVPDVPALFKHNWDGPAAGAALRDKYLAQRREISSLDHERLVVVHPNEFGPARFYTKDGTGTEVEPSPEQQASMEGSLVLHNHPEIEGSPQYGHSPFSMSDMTIPIAAAQRGGSDYALARWTPAAMEVVTRDTVYRVTPGVMDISDYWSEYERQSGVGPVLGPDERMNGKPGWPSPNQVNSAYRAAGLGLKGEVDALQSKVSDPAALKQGIAEIAWKIPDLALKSLDARGLLHYEVLPNG